MKVHLLGKDIFEIQADICVCPLHPSKDLNFGILSKLILQKGGVKVQEDLNAKSALAAHDGKYLLQGQVIPTEPGNLQNVFRHIFFVCLPPWNGKNAEEIMEIVIYCCKVASGNSLKTIVFPCLGTGGFRFPEKISSEAIMQGLASFVFDHPESSLETVYISLYQKSPADIMQWDNILKKMVEEYNEWISGVKTPIAYVSVTGTQGSKRSESGQPVTTASLPKDKVQPAKKAPSDTSSMAPAKTSGAVSSSWWSLPSIFSASLNVGAAQMSATPMARGRLLSDGVEADLTLRLRVAVPWLKAVFGKKG